LPGCYLGRITGMENFITKNYAQKTVFQSRKFTFISQTFILPIIILSWQTTKIIFFLFAKNYFAIEWHDFWGSKLSLSSL